MISRHFPEIDPPRISYWLDEIHSGFPNLLTFALLPESEKNRVSDIQKLFNDRDQMLLGAIFPALITDTGFSTSGASFLCFPRQLCHFLTDDLDIDSADAASRIANILVEQTASQERQENQQLFLVFDSMLSNTGSILAHLFDHLNHRFVYSGVNAGSETFQAMPCLFDNHRLVSNGVIGLVLDGSMQFALQHSYPVSKPLMRASSTSGNRIDKIDGLPAMSVYQRVIASEFGITLTPENFYDYAVHYPFGLVGTLEILVRIPVAFSDDGSIFCVGEVPANSMLRLLKAPMLADSNCVSKLVELIGHDRETPLLAFYCAGRRMHFGDEAAEELQALLEKSGATSMIGALSLGEISTDNELGIPQFHNAAMLCSH